MTAVSAPWGTEGEREYELNLISGGLNLEKRKVTVRIGGQPCSFYSDDPAEAVKLFEMGVDTLLTNDYLAIANAVKHLIP